MAGGEARVTPSGSAGTTLIVQDVTMEGGEVRLFPSTTLRLQGSLTATSTAAGPAVVRSNSNFQIGGLSLTAANHDFTIADGPQAVDFLIDLTSISDTAGSSLTKLGPGVMRINALCFNTGPTIVSAGTLRVDNDVSSSPFTVNANGVLGGGLLGKVGPLTTNAGGTVAPGGDPVVDILRSGPANLTGGRLAIQINPSPGVVGTDRLQVTGTVTLNGATLELSGAAVQVPPASAMIVENDGTADPVVGTFAGLPEGSIVTLNPTTQFTISYVGGDGNDVVLTNLTPITYFLSEGATGTFFDEDVLIVNPNAVAAPITMTFFLPGGGTVVQSASVPRLASVDRRCR